MESGTKKGADGAGNQSNDGSGYSSSTSYSQSEGEGAAFSDSALGREPRGRKLKATSIMGQEERKGKWTEDEGDADEFEEDGDSSVLEEYYQSKKGGGNGGGLRKQYKKKKV